MQVCDLDAISIQKYSTSKQAQTRTMPDPEHINDSVAETSPRAVADGMGMATEEFKISMPIGIGAVLAALASLATCYSGFLLTYLVSASYVGIRRRNILNPF